MFQYYKLNEKRINKAKRTEANRTELNQTKPNQTKPNQAKPNKINGRANKQQQLEEKKLNTNRVVCEDGKMKRKPQS